MRSSLPSIILRSAPVLAFSAAVLAACGGSGDATTTGTGAGGAAGASNGKAGASGTAGKSGSAGNAGGAGTAGSGGASGKAGAAGASGAAGKAGAAGASGAAGKAGASGSSGASGASGAAGTGGAAGAAGAGGSKGGAAGAAGTAGSGGTAGSAGTSGSSGSAGAGNCKTCQQLGTNCGSVNDGCGNVIQCGTCTVAGETCAGAGTPNVCGKPPCTPTTCASQNLSCGPTGDGCGNTIQCGDCTVPGETCGGGGKAGICGSQMCVASSCAAQGISCGPSGDGCGGLLDCGTCPVGQTCGGGGTPGACGAPVCNPKTCANLGLSCGPAADGCGGLLQCGTCNLPQTCNGGGTPGVCATPPSCTGLCLQQVTCPGGGTTTISGVVYAPNGTDPLPNAVVYVPNGPVQPFTPGVSCDTCGAATSGSPLVTATTAIDGKFSLKNVPVGANIPVVIQIGRWRRQITVTTVTQCQDNPLTAAQTHLPRNKGEGDIPLMAFATGAVDALECVMRKIGIEDTEFTRPDGGGRIHIYQGGNPSQAGSANPGNSRGDRGARVNGNGTPYQVSDTDNGTDGLMGSQASLDKYDILLFPCQGDDYLQPTGVRTRLLNYLDKGGRLFATHFSYVWLFQTNPLSTSADWNVNQGTVPNQTGYIDQSFPKGQALAQWLQLVGASTVVGEIPIEVLRHDVNSVTTPPSQSWMTVNDPVEGVVPMHFTFNTPIGTPAAQQCGRVVFDDFHVENVNLGNNVNFPDECQAGAMTPQEKLLEFMMFDLASCVAPDVPTCTAKTCADLGISCGPAGDGCGGILQCGDCPVGQTCGGGGTPSVCGAPSCTATTCMAQGIQCGPAGDGCGGLLQCGTCPMGQTCGGGGVPGVCGAGGCTARNCTAAGVSCGPASDGCGGLLQCGDCPPGQTCGGGGVPGQCGAPPCTKKTCVQLGIECGPAGDGCGGQLDCGTCLAPLTCGGGGVPGICDSSKP